MPVDRKMQGRVLLEAFREEWVEEHPVAYTSVYDSLGAPADVAVGPSEADQALKDKLISLGYVAGGQNALVNLANYYHKSGKYAEALDLYKQILEEDPGNADVKVGMSDAYFKMGQTDLALRGLDEVLARDPGHLMALHSLGNLYVDLGRGMDALQVAERALAVDAGDGESHFIKGIALQQLGRKSEAVEAYGRALKLAPDMPEIYGNLATLYVEDGRTAEALELAETALELAPGRVDLLYVKGSALNAAGRGDEALVQFGKATGADPSYVPAYLGAASVYFARGELDSVIALCDRALAVPSGHSAHAYGVRASAKARLGRMEEAIRDFNSAIEAGPSLVGPRLNLARAYAAQGRTREAREAVRVVLEMYPGHPAAMQLLRSLGE
jgi:tetratricopeptide (TPR) repeat protein